MILSSWRATINNDGIVGKRSMNGILKQSAFRTFVLYTTRCIVDRANCERCRDSLLEKSRKTKNDARRPVQAVYV